MSEQLWAVSVPFPRLTPNQRLAQAIEAAREKPGVNPRVVYAHPATILMTDAPNGTLMIADSYAGIWDFRFPRLRGAA
jgi:hypothetical protein